MEELKTIKADNETIYNFLKTYTSNFKEELNIYNLQILKKSLEEALLVAENKNATEKTRARYCLNYTKSKTIQKKPVLQYSYNGLKDENGQPLQAFTDSWFMVFLKQVDKITTLQPVEDQAGLNYPNVSSFFKSPADIKKSIYNITFNINKLLNYFKLNKPNKKDGMNILTIKTAADGEDVYFALEEKNFKNFIVFMNFKNSDNITLYYDRINFNSNVIAGLDRYGYIYNPFYTINKNESSGLILPALNRDVALESIINLIDLQ